MGVFWEVNIGIFLLVTIALGGGAAYLTGRAVAHTWRPAVNYILYIVILAAAVRFIHYALFHGTLLSLRFYLVDLVILLVIATLGYQVTRAGQMGGQYSWLYERTGGVSWRPRRQN